MTNQIFTKCNALFLFILFCTLFNCAAPDVSSTESETELIVSLVGTVMNDKMSPYEGVVVSMKQLGLRDTTDQNGDYSLLSMDSIAAVNGVDTLIFEVENREVASVEITTFVDTLPDVVIVRRSITGSIRNNDSLPLGSIQGIVYALEEKADTIVIPVDYFPSSGNYSGLAEFHQGAELDSFAVFVRLYDSAGLYIGRSEEVRFSENAGDIQIPVFKAGNMIPQISLTPVAPVISGETVLFSVAPADSCCVSSFEKELLYCSWRIDDSIYTEERGRTCETAIFRNEYDSTVSAEVTLFYKDGTSNRAVQTLSVIPAAGVERLTVSLAGRVLTASGSPRSGVTAVLQYNAIHAESDSTGWWSIDTQMVMGYVPPTDTLNLFYEGTRVGRFPLENRDTTFDTIALYPHRIYGQFLMIYPDLESASLVVLDTASDQILNSYPLNYTKGASYCSGDIFIASETGAEQTVRIRSFNAQRELIGESENYHFSTAEDNNSLKAFDSKNMVPFIEIEEGEVVDSGTTVHLNVTCKGSRSPLLGRIEKFEWQVNGGLYSEGRDSAAFTLEGAPGTVHHVALRIHLRTGDILTTSRDITIADPQVVTYNEDMAEQNSEQWYYRVVEDSPTTVFEDTNRTVAGKGSIAMKTTGGFDAALIFGPKELSIEANGSDTLRFSLYTENENASKFQDENPRIAVVTETGTASYRPSIDIYDEAIGQWQNLFLPFTGDQAWTRTDSGEVDFTRITAIEFHGDTWDYGYTLWLDDVKVVPAKH